MTIADATYFHDHTYRRISMSHRKHLFAQTSNKQAESCHDAACQLPLVPPVFAKRRLSLVKKTAQKAAHGYGDGSLSAHTVSVGASSLFSSEIPTNTQRSNPTNPLSPHLNQHVHHPEPPPEVVRPEPGRLHGRVRQGGAGARRRSNHDQRCVLHNFCRINQAYRGCNSSC